MAAPTYRFNARQDVYAQAIVRAGTYVSQCLARAEEELARAEEQMAMVAVPG
jgi:hypothetical protein